MNTTSGTPSFLKLAIKSALFLVGVVFFLVGLPFLIAGVSIWTIQNQEAEALNQRGQPVLATVIDKSAVHTERPARYMIDFEFARVEGGTIVGSSQMPKEDWTRLSKGDDIQVRYLPEDPEINAVVGAHRSLILPIIFSAMGGLFTLLGSIFLWVAVRGILLFRRLAKEGMPTLAEIIELGPTGVRLNNVRQWRIRYGYVDAMGGRYEGMSPYMSPSQAQNWKAGQTVEVRFDPRQPSVSVWMG